MHSHDTDGVFVGFRYRHFDHPGAFLGLPLDPVDEVPERGSPNPHERPCLLNHKSESAPALPRSCAAETGLHHAPLSNKALNNIIQPFPDAVLVVSA